MPTIIAVHSFRGGTGKSTTAANLAVLLAMGGQRVGVIDTDIQSPGIHVLFGLSGTAIQHSLNDYLWGRCAIEQAAHDVSSKIDEGLAGRLFLIPSSITADAIVNVLRDGYDVSVLTAGFGKLISELSLDALIIDTHPGLNEETLFALAISQVLLIVLRPDQQDYEGTGVTVEVARTLEVPRLLLMVNKTPALLDPQSVRAHVEKTYGAEVAAVLPHSEEVMLMASSDLFVLRYPDHPLTEQYRHVAAQLMG
jgi:septum site-determining protein MinD